MSGCGNRKRIETDENGEEERKGTFAPFISAGVIPVAELKTLVAQMEAEGADNIKLTGEIIFVWGDGKVPEDIEGRSGRKANTFKAGGVRPVKMCSAETFCRRFKKPVLGLAMRIDELYRGVELPMKLAIGVAGCQRSCSEPATKDIGVIANPRGYEILAGGAAGFKPGIATRLAVVLTEEDVIKTVGRIIGYFSKNAIKGHRLGAVIEKNGWEPFKAHALEGVKVLEEDNPGE
ncbi:MAG: NAD(P)/FAD-dependent oxidoreductase [Nitrospinae bacterium]|nr:NAD(P)/FAD-dependent oxidoreductase [Nitrospinota bacterium]